MRRAAGSTLRTAALGGWAVLALAAMPPAMGTAQAAGGHGHGHGATDGPGRPGAHPVHGQAGTWGETPAGGDRREDGDGPAVSAPAADPPSPSLDIGTALGPIRGETAPAAALATGAGVTGPAGRVPLLSFDAPSPFAPRSIAGRVHHFDGPLTVQVAVRRGSPARGCGWWNARAARFSGARRGGCAARRWITASVRRTAAGWRWRASLGGALPDGSFRFFVRVLDAGGRPVAVRRV